MSAPIVPLSVLSLFSGIGGMELGLERAGMRVVGQVEINEFCRSVLARHWPEVPRHDDVRTAPAWWASRPRPRVDLVAGGFPCQPFSGAGWGLGTADQRWGWPWFHDVVAAVRPRYVLIENVERLLRHPDAFGRILHDLSELGFDVQWSVVTACSVGAPHLRRRLFVLAHPHRLHGPTRLGTRGTGIGPLPPPDRAAGAWTDGHHGLLATTPTPSRMAHGTATGLDRPRLTAIGNAVVPAVAEHIGHLITALDQQGEHRERAAHAQHDRS